MNSNYCYWVGQLVQAAETLSDATNKREPSEDLLDVLRYAALSAKGNIEAIMRNLDMKTGVEE